MTKIQGPGRYCPCHRNCAMRIATGASSTTEVMPRPTYLYALRPHLGTIVQAAAEYDSVSQGELTSATDFVWWLQQEAHGVERRPEVLLDRQALLRAHDA